MHVRGFSEGVSYAVTCWALAARRRARSAELRDGEGCGGGGSARVQAQEGRVTLRPASTDGPPSQWPHRASWSVVLLLNLQV